jgi:hypothetical protein
MPISVGLTISDYKNFDKNLFSNGLHQHVYTLYQYFKTIDKIKTYIVSNNKKEEDHDDNFISIYDIERLKCLDYLVVLGLVPTIKTVNILKGNVKIISWKLGNSFEMNMAAYFYDYLEARHDGKNVQYDTTWISPHFDYARDYYRFLYNTEIEVAPYIWSPYFTDKELKGKELLSFENGINIGVLESNIHLLKNCVYPMLICDRLGEEIDHTYIFNSCRLKKNKKFVQFATISEHVRSSRITFEKRYRFSFIVQKYCNVILSHQEHCELNYVYLECFYHGIPLVHNSKMIKDYGYYYEGNDVETAVEHIRNIKRSFNREEYIERNKAAVLKYSSANPEFQNFIIEKFKLDEVEEEEETTEDLFQETMIIS